MKKLEKSEKQCPRTLKKQTHQTTVKEKGPTSCSTKLQISTAKKNLQRQTQATWVRGHIRFVRGKNQLPLEAKRNFLTELKTSGA